MTRSFRTFWSYEPYLSAVLGSFLDGIRSSSYSLTLGGGGVSPSGTLAGKLPKSKQRLVFANNEFSVKSVQEDLVAERPIRDATELRETLEIRARCFHMLKVCEFEVCRKLTERYLSKLRATQAEGMRGPTLNEIRRDLQLCTLVGGKRWRDSAKWPGCNVGGPSPPLLAATGPTGQELPWPRTGSKGCGTQREARCQVPRRGEEENPGGSRIPGGLGPCEGSHVSSSIVGTFWLMAAQLKASIFIHRVE